MASKRIKRVIIAGAGFSAPANLPIQNKIIDRMTEPPEIDFLSGKLPEESLAFLDAFITVGLYLLDNYAQKDYGFLRKKYQRLVAQDNAYNTFRDMCREEPESFSSSESIRILYTPFSEESLHKKYVSDYYSDVYSMREEIRQAIRAENISVNLEDIFTAFDKSVIAKENLHGYTYAQMDKIRFSIMRLFIYYFSQSVDRHDFEHKDYKAFFDYLRTHKTKTPTTIITTNWDTLIERYCEKNSMRYNYGFLQPYTSDAKNDLPPDYALLLLKIHGSSNWLRCLNCNSISVFEGSTAANSLFEDEGVERCPICKKEKTAHGASMQPEIITPTMIKTLSHQLYTNLWAAAASELRHATHIIFVGYSLPIADFEFRYMLQKNVPASAQIDVLLTASSDPKNAPPVFLDTLPPKRYVDAFPKNKINFFYDGFGPYFLADKP